LSVAPTKQRNELSHSFLWSSWIRLSSFATIALFLLSFRLASAQVGEFSRAADIGGPKRAGSSTYDEATQTYTLKGGGYNIWFNHDEFHFLYKRIKGDFLLTANFQLIGNETGNAHRKTGWMIRETAEHDAVSVNSCLHGDGLVVLQWRPMRGAYMRDPEEEVFFPKQYFGENVIQLERMGKRITMRMAHPGEPLEDMGSITLPELKDEVLIGPYALAHETNGLQEVRVWNVRIATPVAPDWHPNRQVKTTNYASFVFSSRIETLEVATGKRLVLHETTDKIGGLAFSPDGREAVFESGGKIQSVSTTGGPAKPSAAPPATKRIESDGQFLYFAEGRTGTGQIWRKKLDGTDSRQLTHDLEHAWFPQLSPDAKWLVYLAYPHDANPQKPVAYHRVSLKLMPVSGGAPRTIAHLFGGAGSFEHPCWSPDGTKILLVSNGEKR
jgi:hypothetical protein